MMLTYFIDGETEAQAGIMTSSRLCNITRLEVKSLFLGPMFFVKEQKGMKIEGMQKFSRVVGGGWGEYLYKHSTSRSGMREKEKRHPEKKKIFLSLGFLSSYISRSSNFFKLFIVYRNPTSVFTTILFQVRLPTTSTHPPLFPSNRYCFKNVIPLKLSISSSACNDSPLFME